VYETVSKFLTDIKKSKENKESKDGTDHTRLIALLVLGEVGRQTDLSEHKDIDTVVFSAFDSKVDGVRNAASFALGNISVGNMKKFLPILLDFVKQHADRRYLLLSALKEIIQQHSVLPNQMELFRSHVTTVSPILFDNTDAKDEGVRTMVAACLGRLLVIDSNSILPKLEQLVSSDSPNTRTVVVMSLRFSFADASNVKALGIVVGPKLQTFLNSINDKDMEVKRQSCLTVNALLRANESLIRRDTLDNKLLPALYSATTPKPELVVEIDYGAFKKLVDQGLPLRKAAFQALETLLEVAPHRVNMNEYIKYMQQGLVEEYDLQISTFSFFRRIIAKYHASSLLEVLDNLPALVVKSVQEHLKSVKLAPGSDPTVDPLKAADALRSFVHAVAVFNQIPGVELSKKYTFFVSQVFATAYLKQIMEEVEKSTH